MSNWQLIQWLSDEVFESDFSKNNQIHTTKLKVYELFKTSDNGNPLGV